MNEVTALIDAIIKKEKLTAMLAPSFPIVFSYPDIISRLRKLGFSYVVEVSAGAKRTNQQIIELLKNNPSTRIITSPCPTIVRLIKKQMPQYAKYLTPNIDSPMVATAKIVAEKFPGTRPVFIGPCIVKKFEATEDVPELNILVLTYSEMLQVFEHFKILEEADNPDQFDISEPGLVRTYPLDGGLSHSSGLIQDIAKDEIQIVSGWKNSRQAILDFETNTKVRLLDVLFCEAGCINGPGINSPLTNAERINRITDYSQK